MNVINQFFLRIFLSPSVLYRKAGIDMDQLRLILTTKLIIDDRRPNTFHRSRQTAKKISLATLGTMAFSAVLGCMFLFAFTSGNNLQVQLIFYFSIYMFMLISTLIADFTSVLFDVKDNTIILPKPVSDKTFVISRLVHIIMHCTKIVLPMTLPGLIFIIYRNGIATALSFFVVLVMATLFTIFLINAIYLVVLKVTTPQKFNSVISYVQIILSIAVYAGFQFFPKYLTDVRIDPSTFQQNLGMWLIPSYWFALATVFFSSFTLEFNFVTSAVITLLACPLSIWLVIKYFAPAFTQKLSQINAGSETENVLSTKNITKPNTLAMRLAKWTTTNTSERLSFTLSWTLTSRLKDFKLKVYPSIGYIIVYMAVIFLRDAQQSMSSLLALDQQGIIIIISALYSFSLILLTAINQLPFSEHYKAAWIYFSLPLQKPGNIILGAYKAVVIKFYVPFILVISCTALYLFGLKIILNLLLSFSNTFLTGLIYTLFIMKMFPFSMQQNASEKSGSFIKVLFSLIIPFILAFIHFFIFKSMIAIVVAIFCSLILNYMLLQRLRKRSWTVMASPYSI